jgi:hypothetical protein
MPYTIASPSPVPEPTDFVVKNGSKMRGRTSVAMPQPLSSTLSSTNSPAWAPGCRAASSDPSVTLRVPRASVPPSGMASRAFTHRFMSTCWIWPGSACAVHSSGSSTVVSRTVAGSIRRSSAAVSPTVVLSAAGRGRLASRRLNASRPLVSSAHRSAA